ncbi:MAG: TRAP transporter large permease subunit [Acidobacteriota bacterium]
MTQEPSHNSTLDRIENTLPIFILLLMSVLPLIEIVGRLIWGKGIPGSIVLVQNLTLWIAVFGAVLAARSNQLLALSTQSFLPDKWNGPIKIITYAFAAGISTCIFLAGMDHVLIARETGDIAAWGIPTWIVIAIIPVSFAILTIRFIRHASSTLRGRLLTATGLLIPFVFYMFTTAGDMGLLLPVSLVIILATALGMPIFAAIGGAALLLFWLDGTPLNAVPMEAYRLTVSPMLAAIPLFALAGYILAEGGSSRRLTRFFTAFAGWLPGGTAIAITLVLAFFTPLTGASGMTILSMGGLFLPILIKAGYPYKTSIGLITVAGSIGLLFPPSLPVFLYAFKAETSFQDLFIGGFFPGVLLVVVVGGWAAIRGHLGGAKRTPFRFSEARAALWESKWEILLPVALLVCFGLGFATLVETAAVMVFLAFFIECVIHRDLSIRHKLPHVFVECATLVGGFMIILCMALGFTNYLIIAEVPDMALAWVQSNIENPLLFLLALNIFLVIIGALMDIYSAVIVIVPLITPMAAAYGIDPIHLGVIFLANMELGYLMPPMGENLFLSAYRFDKPLVEVYRSTLPYVVVLAITVLLITYIPMMSMGLVQWLK